jgi:hypothetical protein
LYREKDIKFADHGDIELEGGDLKLTKEFESLSQDVKNRAKTNNPDWYLHDRIGSNLEDLRGEKNTKDTGQIGEENIISSLLYGDRIKPEDLNVKGVPTAKNEITFYTFINAGQEKPLLELIKVNL